MRSKPKKSLGQNFLQDPNIRRKIIAACGFSGKDTVVEIGPGQAAMTGLIAPQVKKLVAVEIDRALAHALAARFQDDPHVTVIHGDFLEYDLSKAGGTPSHTIKVFGNIPYYITSPIIEHLIRFRDRISNIYVTAQKEFARRIVAAPGSDDYGSFSCYVQYYTRPKIEFTIKRTCFFPAPKVDSCFISLAIRQSPAVRVRDEDLLFRVIRTAFQQRRKTLRNSLKGIIPVEALDLYFERSGKDPRVRAETLSLQDFADLMGTLPTMTDSTF